METFTTALFTIAAAVWIGAIVFQSAIVAPAVFVDLDEAAARSFLRTLFPRFFRLGLVCGALMLASLVLAGSLGGWSATGVVLAAGTATMFALGGISLALVPHINAARDQGDAGAGRFRRLHGASVLLTIGVLLIGIALLALVAARAAPGV